MCILIKFNLEYDTRLAKPDLFFYYYNLTSKITVHFLVLLIKVNKTCIIWKVLSRRRNKKNVSTLPAKADKIKWFIDSNTWFIEILILGNSVVTL